jgi:hypothetical protein
VAVVPELEKIQRQHVLSAISEHHQLGSDVLLDGQAGGQAGGQGDGQAGERQYQLLHEQRSYDAQAVVAAAHERAVGYPVPDDELPGRDAARLLQVLAFEVQGPELPRLAYTNAATVGPDHARATWALAARELLVETAKRYHAVVRTQDLAEFVQRRSLLRTSQQPQHWMGDVLSRITAECAHRREPFLSALCVDGHGRVGVAYRHAVEQHRGAVYGDLDVQAAEERLECYRHFGATLPPGGGVPAMPPQAAPRGPASRGGGTHRGTGSRGTGTGARAASSRTAAGTTERARTARASRAPAKPAAAEKPLALCPVHFEVLPASGICDLCE